MYKKRQIAQNLTFGLCEKMITPKTLPQNTNERYLSIWLLVPTKNILAVSGYGGNVQDMVET